MFQSDSLRALFLGGLSPPEPEPGGRIVANPSPAAIAAIRSHVADWGPDDPAIADDLDTPSIANPVPQGTVPNPLYESALLSLLTDAVNGSLVKLINWPNFGLLKADIEAQNRDGVLLWCQALTAAGILTQGECEAIATYVGGTQADPDYQSLLSWAQVHIGRPVDSEDIAASRPSGD